MPRKKHSMFYDTAKLNMRTFDYYMRRFFELGTTSIEWVNLPPEVDERYLEMTLYNHGACVFFRDEDAGVYAALNGALGGSLNIYGIPNERFCEAVNGYQVSLNESNSVIIYNNFIHCPTVIDMELYAYRLYELERSVDVNIKGQKTPKIILCTENERLTMQNMMMQYEGNYPFIFGNKGLNVDGVSAIDISSPFVADKLQIAKRQIFNEALTFLGIENNSNEKAERLVTNEAISNIGAVKAQRDARLAARQQACEQINRMFGLNISVKFKQDLADDMEQEVDSNGELDN